MRGPVGWGVIPTTSAVAQEAVLPAIAASPKAQLVAVASRSAPPDTFGARRVYHRYDSLLEDPDVEIVYLALPNHLHAEWTTRAAAAGKHVLCEKPLGRSGPEAEAMAAACRRAGVVLAEAYMTPFHPRSALMADIVRSGRLGPLEFAHAAFTTVLGRPGNHRWRPDAGGGALLDLGVYVVAPLLAAAGGRSPAAVAGAARMTESGVDVSCSAWLDFGHGFSATVECSFDAPERQLLEIVGRDAALRLTHNAFTPAADDRAVTLIGRDGAATPVTWDGGGEPAPTTYRAMVEHLCAAVRDGATLGRPPEEAVAVLAVLDRIRDAAGMA